jgi:hypothetical protein
MRSRVLPTHHTLHTLHTLRTLLNPTAEEGTGAIEAFRNRRPWNRFSRSESCRVGPALLLHIRNSCANVLPTIRPLPYLSANRPVILAAEFGQKLLSGGRGILVNAASSQSN